MTPPWPPAQRRNSGPGAAREPRPTDQAPSYTIRAEGSGSHPSGVEWANDRPATTITTTRRSSKGGLVGHSLDALWPDKRPSTTVNGDPRISKPGHHDEHTSGSQQAGAIRVTVEEAAALQSFPAGFPWQGTKTKRFRQVGNAIPPLLAYHILRSATGRGDTWESRPERAV
jgi:site-specific DNA-cytosine methylase